MIALTAYGIRKAYKKQQARKARKEQLERRNQGPTAADPSDDYHSLSSSSDRLSSDPTTRHSNGRLVNYDQRSQSSLTQAPTASGSGYSDSLYSPVSYKDPLEEMRQYQAYIQRQSHGFGRDIMPPTYDFVVEQGIEPTHPWKSGLMIPGRAHDMEERQEARHIPQVPNRVVELDSPSESPRSPTGHVPLRLFHPRSPATHNDRFTYPVAELPADLPEHIVSPILYDELQVSLDELVAEVPSPLRIKKSTEAERHELPANEITPAPAEDDIEHDQEHEELHKIEHEEVHNTEHERLQLKRPRAESGSDIESEDNEQVIVRFNVADRTKRPFSRRFTTADGE